MARLQRDPGVLVSGRCRHACARSPNSGPAPLRDKLANGLVAGSERPVTLPERTSRPLDPYLHMNILPQG